MNDISTQQLNLPLLATKEDCLGGTFIVTGSNTGLGLEAARHFVALGAAKVILAVRSIDKGQLAKADIESSTNTTGVAEVWELDLTKFDSVRAFAKRAISELNRIDALVENAAVAAATSEKVEGHKMAITVNVLSTFLLAVLLLPKMMDAAKQFGTLPHITIVASRVGFDVSDEWKLIQDDPLIKVENTEPVLKTYPISKLMEIMAVRYLASLVPVSQTGVVINVVCPGLCKTELSRNSPPDFQERLAKMHAEYGRSAEDGSRTLLHGAVAGKDSHGCLLHSCGIGEDIVPSWVTDDEGVRGQKRMWDAIAKELDSVENGCVARILRY